MTRTETPKTVNQRTIKEITQAQATQATIIHKYYVKKESGRGNSLPDSSCKENKSKL